MVLDEGGARVEADSATESPAGVWYNRGAMSIFILLAPDFLLIALARSLISGAQSAYLYEYLNAHDAGHLYLKVEGVGRSYSLVGKIVYWPVIGLLMQWNMPSPYWLTAINAAIAAVALLAGCSRDPSPGRVLVLGLDGIDPDVMSPRFESLREMLSRLSATRARQAAPRPRRHRHRGRERLLGRDARRDS